MQLNDYQEKAMTTCLPTSENFAYMFLNLVGEVGEFASKVAKGIRKGYYNIGRLDRDNQITIVRKQADNPMYPEFTGVQMLEEERLLQKEAGDILWQLAGLCHVMNWKLEDIAQQNLDKLASRQQRNVIDGSGDNR